MFMLHGENGNCIFILYCNSASKSAVFGLTEALMSELYALYKHCQVQTTTVCPSFVNTKLINAEEVTKRITRKDR